MEQQLLRELKITLAYLTHYLTNKEINISNYTMNDINGISEFLTRQNLPQDLNFAILFHNFEKGVGNRMKFIVREFPNIYITLKYRYYYRLYSLSLYKYNKAYYKQCIDDINFYEPIATHSKRIVDEIKHSMSLSVPLPLPRLPCNKHKVAKPM
jgi:hypothetical protein